MKIKLTAAKEIIVNDLRYLLDIMTFSTPNLWLFGVIRRYLVKRRFQNFGGQPNLGSPIKIGYPSQLRLDGYALIANDVYIEARGGVKIGVNCGIASGTTIRTEAHIISNPDIPFYQQGHSVKPVIIGEDVWIANNCFVLPGTTIGDHSVIASGSVVSGVIPPYSIMAGNPARRVGSRKKLEEKEP